MTQYLFGPHHMLRYVTTGDGPTRRSLVSVLYDGGVRLWPAAVAKDERQRTGNALLAEISP